MNSDTVQRLLDQVKPYTLLSEGRLRNLIRLCEHVNAANIPGDFVECGTMNGGSAGILSQFLRQDRHLWLYDSFAGMPEPIEKDGDEAKQWAGKCVGSIKNVTDVMNLVSTDPSQYTIKQGWFHQTFQDQLPQQVSLLHCDADWYESVKLVLETFYDLIPDGGCIVLDDFGYWEGCRNAFYDFCFERGEKPLLERFEDSQAYWIKGQLHNRVLRIDINFQVSALIAELEEAHSKLAQQHNQLEYTKTQIEQLQTQIKQVRSRKQTLKVELQRAKNQIAAMESSKFWKLRTQWFHLKHAIKTLRKFNADFPKPEVLLSSPFSSPVFSPLTLSNDVTLLECYSARQLVEDWKTYFRIDIHSELGECETIELYQCNQTHLKFFMPLTVAGSDKLYEQLAASFDWYYMPHKWEYDVALRDLADCQTVLEIGSGCGHFIKLGLQAGLAIQGIELNHNAVAIAQQHHLPIQHLDLNDAAIRYAQSLDAVCSFQVLGHTPQPKAFIESSIHMLKPGGKLILCVPNAESFLKYQYNLLDMPPHHMHRWSKTTFQALETLFPLKLEKIRYEPLAPYHVEGYLQAYQNRWRQFALGRLVFNPKTLPLYQQWLNLGLRKFLVGQSLYVQFRKI